MLIDLQPVAGLLRKWFYTGKIRVLDIQGQISC